MILNGRERTCSHFSFNFKYYMYKKRISCVAENKINKKKRQADFWIFMALIQHQ